MTTIAPHLSVEALGQRLDNAGWHAPADLRVPEETTDWRAVCGKTACTVRRAG